MGTRIADAANASEGLAYLSTGTSVGGSPGFVETIAGSGSNNSCQRIAQSRLEGAESTRPRWQVKWDVTCSSAAEGCEPEVFWVPETHNQEQWLLFSLRTPAHVVGISIGANADGSKGQCSRGFHVTELVVAARAPGATEEKEVDLQDADANFPTSGVGTIMFLEGATVSALRISPKAWSSAGIGMSVALLVERLAGPANVGFSFSGRNNGVVFDANLSDLYVFDSAPVSNGGLQKYRVSSQSQHLRVRAAHVPRYYRTGNITVRRIGFGPEPEHTMYAITAHLVYHLCPEDRNLALLAGGGAAGNNATGAAAGFHDLADLCITDSDIYLADQNMVKCVSFAGVVTTFAGSQQAGHVDANGESARFSNICGVSFDRDVGAIICADTNNHRIRKILIRTREASTVAGTGVAELRDGIGTASSFSRPEGVVASKRWIFVCDTGNHALRCVSPDGVVSTVAGGESAGFRDGFGAQALLHEPAALSHDGAGRFYFVDRGSQRVRTFTADVGCSIAVPPSDLCDVLAALCDESEAQTHDLVLSAGGCRVPGVRAIVCGRSPYLAALIGASRNVSLLGSDTDRETARAFRFADQSAGNAGRPVTVEIENVSSDALRIVMVYLHSDRVLLPGLSTQDNSAQDSVSNNKKKGKRDGQAACADDPQGGGAALAVEVLTVAGKFKLPRLQAECERKIAASIRPDNVSTLLRAADQAAAQSLRAVCKAFLVRNFKQARRAPDFAELPQHLLVEVALDLTVQQ